MKQLRRIMNTKNIRKRGRTLKTEKAHMPKRNHAPFSFPCTNGDAVRDPPPDRSDVLLPSSPLASPPALPPVRGESGGGGRVAIGGSAGSPLGDSDPTPLIRMSAADESTGSKRPRPMFGEERASVEGGGGNTEGMGLSTSTLVRFDSNGPVFSSSIPRFSEGVLSRGCDEPLRGKGLGGERFEGAPFRIDWGEGGWLGKDDAGRYGGDGR